MFNGYSAYISDRFNIGSEIFVTSLAAVDTDPNISNTELNYLITQHHGLQGCSCWDKMLAAAIRFVSPVIIYDLRLLDIFRHFLELAAQLTTCENPADVTLGLSGLG